MFQADEIGTIVLKKSVALMMTQSTNDSLPSDSFSDIRTTRAMNDHTEQGTNLNCEANEARSAEDLIKRHESEIGR